MDDASRLYLLPPALKWVNPSDCVDMDCDGAKHVLMKDLDGSLTGTAGASIISMAEYEWDGDPRRGLGEITVGTIIVSGCYGVAVPKQ